MSETETNLAAMIAAAAAEAMAKNLPPLDPKAADNFALVPDGYSLKHINGRPDEPVEMGLKPSFYEAESLAEYVNRFWTGNAVAFTDWRKASIHVDFCYLAGSEGGNPGTKHWSDHSATFAARSTESWSAWSALHEKMTTQRLFIRFLEEHAHEIVDPDAAAVVDVCMNFEAVKRVEFKSSQRLSDGYRQFVYVEDNQGSGKVDLPEVIAISVPIFEGQEPVRVKVRVRSNIEEGKLMLGLAIDNMDEIRRTAFERCLDTFRSALSGGAEATPVYKGAR